MSYTPHLLINKKDLQDNLNLIYSEQESKDVNISHVAKYLITALQGQPMKFGELELIMCQPEMTEFNMLVRKYLHELDVHFQVNY